MKKLVIVLCIIVLVGATTIFIASKQHKAVAPTTPTSPTVASNQPSTAPIDIPAETTIAENLDTPWALALLPDGKLLVTERFGRVSLIDPSGKTQPQVVATIPAVKEIGEGGLLGIALHPDFATNTYVYLYYTYSSSNGDPLNRVVRMIFANKTLSNEQILLDKIPGASNHDGGRIKFGPDKFLYIGTGDAQNPSQAQTPSALGGKILRITDAGKPAPGNPFNNFAYSLGHRNVQGLAWDSTNQLWATEHGRSGVTTGYDELNMILPGKNYGWPDIQGEEQRSGMVTPVYNSGPTTTWAPSGAAIIGKSIFFSGLKGESLYETVIGNGKVTAFHEHLKGSYGRIREVIATPDGLLYITTSNRDSRGTPRSGDDKIIRINPAKL